MYANLPSTSACQGFPSVILLSVNALCLAMATNATYQSAHAVAPDHECGGKSSRTVAGEAHVAATILPFNVLNPSTKRLTCCSASDASEAGARPAPSEIARSNVRAAIANRFIGSFLFRLEFLAPRRPSR